MATKGQSDSFLAWQGKTLGGRYRLEALLRHDDLTAVYKASDPDLQRTVSIHLFNPRLTVGAQFQADFEKWATATARLSHPHIAQVYDFGREGGTYYIVSQYLAGVTLAEWLARLKTNNRRPDEATIMRIAGGIAAALDYAHDKGVVHRNVQPGNVILDARDEPILTGFGLAPILRAFEVITFSGGTLDQKSAAYLSPEQVLVQKIDNRADLYALGVIVYEMMAGEQPFRADTPLRVALMHVNEPVPDLRRFQPGASPELAQLLAKALAKDPDRRFQTAGEMVAAVGLAAGAPTEGKVSSATPGSDVHTPVTLEPVTTNETLAATSVNSLRLDVAAPDKVEVGRAFDIAAAVRQLASPKIAEEDLRRVKSGFLRLNWPRARRAIRLRLAISAPDCQLHGQDSYSFRLYRGQDSPLFYFHLTAGKAGDISIIVTVYQEQDSLGSARIRTTAYGQAAGQVEVKITSQALQPDSLALAQLRQKLADHFNLDELRTLCFDLGIEYENFPATKEGMTREIVLHCRRQGQLPQLLEHCRQLRPAMLWQL